MLGAELRWTDAQPNVHYHEQLLGRVNESSYANQTSTNLKPKFTNIYTKKIFQYMCFHFSPNK